MAPFNCLENLQKIFLIIFIYIINILIFIFIKSLQRYEEIDEKILDDHVLDIYAEIYDELNDMLYVEKINDPFINLEEKVSNFFKKC